MDEAALRRDHTGSYSWYPSEPGGRIWGKSVGSSIRWGIVQCLLTYWTQGTPEEQAEHQAKPPRKRRKKGGQEPAKDPEVEGWIRKFECPNQTLHCWNCTTTKTPSPENGNMRTEMFLPYLKKVLEFIRGRFPSRAIELHIDNAQYHKQNSDYSRNLNSLNVSDLVGWVIRNAPPGEGFDCEEAFEDQDGNLPSKAELLALALQFQIDPLNKVQALVAEFGGTVEYTAPYWSMAQPMEDYFNNLKFDYGSCWDALHRGKNVGQAVHMFQKGVPQEHIEGWVRYSDDFCFRVDVKDKATFDLGSYEQLVEHGLA